MISDLIIKNFAIIESLHVSFDAGFNVLTGETGAGKSIILDAVNLLLGGRARGDVIRTGADEATVEAIFSLAPQSALRAQLDDAGLSDGDELMVRRIVSRSGKNRVFVNGSLISLGQLRELVGQLVNIYGQHEHQSLQRADGHLLLLDSYAGLQDELERYRTLYSNWQQLQQQLANLETAERERQQRIDLLSYQRQELDQAALSEGEDVALEQERQLLLHSGKLLDASAGGYDRLYAGQEAVCAVIAGLATQLETLENVDPALAVLAENLRNSQYVLEDVAGELQRYADKLDFEPQRQQQVEDRLALLTGLKRKYAPTLDGLLAYQQQIAVELDELDSIEVRRDQLSGQVQQAYQALLTAASALSEKRALAASSLSQTVEAELHDLAMGGARFEMQLSRLAQPSVNGFEQGEFFLAANVGEDPQPLARIASGGELSRIMLAIKRSAPQADGVTTLIFDEVDAGIGGEAATAVGEKISRLGQDFQVLCVTHLAQVAAFSDAHYHVHKVEENGRTTTRLSRLSEDEKIAEIARMSGGLHAGRQALEHARELVALSRSIFA